MSGSSRKVLPAGAEMAQAKIMQRLINHSVWESG